MEFTLRGGGGRGGNGLTIYGYGTINATNPSMHRSGPPLTAIDRFLSGQRSHFPQHHHEAHNIAKNNNANAFDKDFCGFSSFGGSSYGFLWPNTQEASFVDGLLANEEALKWRSTHQTPSLCMKDDVQVLRKNAKVVGRRTKKESYVGWIKGQWTDEEDRLSKLKRIYAPFSFA